MNEHEVKTQLQKIISSLEELCEAIDGGSGKLPSDAIQRLKDRKCLYCHLAIAESERESRGCHAKCAQRIRRAIREGKTTDQAAISRGIWAPAQAGGRPAEVSPFFIPDMQLEDTSDEDAEKKDAIKELRDAGLIKPASDMPTAEPIGPESAPVGRHRKKAKKIPSPEEVKETLKPKKSGKKQGGAG